MPHPPSLGVVRIPSPSGGCCDCAQQSGCDCNDLCGFTCRQKAADIDLCGFDEFGTPSTPPRRYKHKETLGTMIVCRELTVDCENDCPGQVRLSYSGSPPGVPCTITATGTFELLTPGSPNSTYKAHDCIAACDGDPIGCRLQINDGGIETIMNNGDTHDFTTGHTVIVTLQVNYVTWINATNRCVEIGKAPFTIFKDTWDDERQWGAVSSVDCTCVITSETNHSAREQQSGFECGDQGEGSPVAFPCTGDPPECYGSGVIVVTPTNYQRGTVGNGCVNNDPTPGVYSYYSGSITETLSDEDTEQVALARNDSCLSWSSCAGCGACSAFITQRTTGYEFAYRSVQVQGQAGTLSHPLIVGHTYKLDLNFWRRTCCGSGAYIYDSTISVTFVAAAPIEYTPWLDMPNDVGYETIIHDCVLTDIT